MAGPTAKKKKKRGPTLAQKKLIAFHRFGLGAKQGSFAKMGKNPKKALLRELNTRNIALIAPNPKLPSYKDACYAGEVGSVNGMGHESIRRNERDARFQKHMEVPIGFVERLVLFFSNHFSMTVNKTTLINGTMGQMERDVIRKHVLGKFENMLIGVITHPAMIYYLDNHDSTGPNSVRAKNDPSKGYNVNLAREIMELHTIGSGGGYKPADVDALAKIITGWSYVSQSEGGGGYNGGTEDTIGQFIFKKDWHEPGTITHMGVAYPDEGVYQGIKVLRKLARSPKTAEHLAFKLVRHFITDNPTPKMVKPVARAYKRSGGNIKKMAIALLNLPQAWKMPLKKFRTPYETAVAHYRALGMRHTDHNGNPSSDTSTYKEQDQIFLFLNHKPWEWLTPDGYPDESWAWLHPDAIRVRIDATYHAMQFFADDFNGDPVALAKNILGPNVRSATLQRIAAAGDKYKALTILFLSPEFLRR